MRLRSGKVTTNKEAIQKRRYIRRMTNPPNNNGETMVEVSMFEVIPSTTSTTIIPSSTHSGPILSPVRTQGQPVTPYPVGTNAFRPYVSGFTMHLNDCEQPYGMPTSTMENLQNATSTLADPLMNIFSPLQGYESVVNNVGWVNQPPGVGFSKCSILLQTLQQF